MIKTIIGVNIEVPKGEKCEGCRYNDIMNGFKCPIFWENRQYETFAIKGERHKLIYQEYKCESCLQLSK